MANPIIQAIYDLKDNISGKIKTINEALRGNRKESDATTDAVEKNNKRASDSYKQTAEGIGNLRAALAAVAAFVGLDKIKDGLAEIIDVGEQFDDLEKKFASAFGGLEAGTAALEKVRALAANTPQAFDDVAAAAIKLKQAGFDPLDGTLQALLDNQNALDQSQEGLIATIEALGKANIKGVVGIKQLVTLIESGVPVFDLLGKAMGVSSERVRELAESGQLGSESIKLLVSELGKLRAGAASAELGDFDSQLTKLRDTGREFLNTIAKSGALDFFREKLKDLNKQVNDAAESGKLKELAKSISDGIIATGQAISSAISFVTQYAGALLQLGRAYAVFKTADFVAGMVRSAGGLATAAAAARKASGDVEGAAGSFGRLGAAIGKIPKQIQFAVVAVAVDFALNQVEKLVAATQEYIEVQKQLHDIQGEAAAVQTRLADKAKTFAELFKSSADVQIASAEELAEKSRLQSAAYVEQLQNATRYYTALRVQLRAAGDDEGVSALTIKLRELGVALGAAQASLERAGGSITASTGAFARDAVHAFEAATAAGKDTANALKGIFDKVDLGTPKGAKDIVEAIEVIGPRARDAKAILEGELLTALQKLDGQGLRNFQTSAIDAFDNVKGGAQEAAIILQASLEAGLTRLGLKASEAGVAITATGRDTLATFQAVAENIAASSEQIEKAFEAAVGKASTKEEVKALGQAFKDAAEQGRVGFQQTADAAAALTLRMQEIEAASSPLAGNFERLGIKSKASLDAAKDAARSAFEAIVEGARRGQAAQDDVRAAFVAYEAAARAAVANATKGTQEQTEAQLKVLAATSGVADAYVAAGDAGKEAGDKVADSFRNAAAGIGDAATAADNLAENSKEASEALDETAAAAKGAADGVQQAGEGIVVLTIEQTRLLRALAQDIRANGGYLADYEERVRQVMEGTNESIETQMALVKKFNDQLNDLQSQLAGAEGDDVAVENLRHERKMDDLKNEQDLTFAQLQQLEALEKKLHEANLRRIKEEQQARNDSGDSSEPLSSTESSGSGNQGRQPEPSQSAPSISSVFNILLLSGDQRAADQLGDLVARRVDRRIKEFADLSR